MASGAAVMHEPQFAVLCQCSPAAWKQKYLRLPNLRTCCGLLLFGGLLLLSPLLFTGKLSTVPSFLPAHIRISPTGLMAPVKLLQQLSQGKVYPIQPNVCPKNGKHPYLVIFVPSRPGYADERAAVRETWGLHGRLCDVRIVFGFGTFGSAEVQHEALIENSVYGDLLQTGNVVDGYHNQTQLILSFFEWAAVNCHGAQFIAKADEDTWINVQGVLRYLHMPEAAQAITGHFLWNEVAKRLPEQKWFVTLDEYPNTTYPPFAVGQLYVFPNRFLPAILDVSQRIRIHWLDDVYIAGQIPDALHLPLLHVKERAHLWEIDGLDCIGRDFYIIHATPANVKRKIFYDSCMQQYRQSSCPYAETTTTTTTLATLSTSRRTVLARNRSAVVELFDGKLLLPGKTLAGSVTV
ncbi:N-acetyllactosaminide beta-1,3-N-acetylglucosaminyltransferase 4-like [Paramacrobiotus metropolitanus]|uniref:N-acetyllactosaminide beta-1,3-N-acetylglucosaminyltransferase 4-like n=1 Tax=Paramacrobiotus metropolitanus TaxID=2943436 RepID=UPI002445C314|nr:N-acetyllactosaminide beta-1,3-N-acetylglucosaminyltransferase 4-like [Paramacrobiotus metropolitanus]